MSFPFFQPLALSSHDLISLTSVELLSLITVPGVCFVLPSLEQRLLTENTWQILQWLEMRLTDCRLDVQYIHCSFHFLKFVVTKQLCVCRTVRTEQNRLLSHCTIILCDLIIKRNILKDIFSEELMKFNSKKTWFYNGKDLLFNFS